MTKVYLCVCVCFWCAHPLATSRGRKGLYRHVLFKHFLPVGIRSICSWMYAGQVHGFSRSRRRDGSTDIFFPRYLLPRKWETSGSIFEGRCSIGSRMGGVSLQDFLFGSNYGLMRRIVSINRVNLISFYEHFLCSPV